MQSYIYSFGDFKDSEGSLAFGGFPAYTKRAWDNSIAFGPSEKGARLISNERESKTSGLKHRRPSRKNKRRLPARPAEQAIPEIAIVSVG